MTGTQVRGTATPRAASTRRSAVLGRPGDVSLVVAWLLWAGQVLVLLAVGTLAPYSRLNNDDCVESGMCSDHIGIDVWLLVALNLAAVVAVGWKLARHRRPTGVVAAPAIALAVMVPAALLVLGMR